MRERGLKSVVAGCRHHAVPVAPHAGAWIEISRSPETGSTSTVAPHAGAWIEICTARSNRTTGGMSLPMRERGLKSQRDVIPVGPAMSLPMRERGLKSVDFENSPVIFGSLPMRERGLKCPLLHGHGGCDGRSPCGSVDWNWFKGLHEDPESTSLPMRERGLK